MADIVKVGVWALVLSGGWTVARHLQPSERTFRSPHLAQVHGKNGSQAELARQLRDTHAAAERMAAEVRLLLRRQERSTRLLAQRLAQLEQRLGTRPTPRVADRVG